MASPTQGDLTLKVICNELSPIRTKLLPFGIQLGISRSKVEEFMKKDDPLSAVVNYWLKGNVTESNYPISWKSIVEALKSEHVGELGLAQQIRKKYCQQQEAIGDGCSDHGGKELELFCETCGKTICWKCIMKGSKHHSHDYKEIHNEEMMSALMPLENHLAATEKALKLFDDRQNEIYRQRVTTESEIHNTFAHFHETLVLKKAKLVSQLDMLTEAKLKSLAAQKEQIENTRKQLSERLCSVKETPNQEEALMNTPGADEIKKLTTTFRPDMLKPSTEADIIFLALEDLTFGDVYASGPPDPSKCCAISRELDTAAVGKNFTTILQTFNFDSRPCNVPKTSISCELVSEIRADTRTRGSIERKGHNQYEISYQPTIKGRHQLHIKVKDQHIKGSPFPISARSPPQKLSTPILTICGVKGAIGVAVTQKGEVVVTECTGHRVSVFSQSGEKLRSFGTQGSQNKQFKHPFGVAIDAEDNILVAESSNNRIQKFTADGKFLKAVGTEGNGKLQFKRPLGIAVSAIKGLIYVAEGDNNRIQILKCDLSYYDKFGSTGNGNGQFICPHNIAFDSTGNVYVTDSENHRIQVFAAEGKFLRKFGRRGGGRGELNWPYGIGIDCGRVYVSERWNHRISVFTTEGVFVTSFGSEGEGPGQFKQPQGLAVDNSGVLYVCEEIHNLVKLL